MDEKTNFDSDQSANQILRLIEKVPIFTGLNPPEQRLISRKFKLVTTQPNEIIIEQGDSSDHLYIIVTGQVTVTRQKESGEWVKVETLRPGDFFGEIAILREIPRTARVSSQTNCSLLTLEARHFVEIYQYLTTQSKYNIQMVVEKRLAELASLKSQSY
ncbi:MAG: cyclic nucleotide-binding domain-containing protein [Legionellaceae bacterium]|nr:cyclic nucleotide-binding domain-containing protein [Legionellaceae bacterium]